MFSRMLINIPFTIFMLFTIFFFSETLPSYAGGPTELVKQTVDKVIEILKDKELKKPHKTEERRVALRKAIDERFDYEEMAKRSLGIHWAKRTPQERKEFVSLFTGLIERSYINKIERYSDETILYISESIDLDYSVVRTKIITKRNIEVPIDYRLHKSANQWKVYDISIEGVSLVSNYRNQFNRIIRTHSYDELVKRLKTKKDEILFEEKA